MSMIYCEKHHRQWDSDFLEICPECEHEPEDNDNRSEIMTKIERAEKKIEIAIDKMIDLKDMGFGTDEVERILEMLNSVHTKLNEHVLTK